MADLGGCYTFSYVSALHNKKNGVRNYSQGFHLHLCALSTACGHKNKPAPPDPLLNAGAAKSDAIVFNSDRTTSHQIYRMLSDGTNLHRLTNDNNYHDWWSRLSPDRRHILFYRRPTAIPENQQYQEAALWIINADGTNPQLLRAKGIDGWLLQAHAEWSPDGTRIAMCGTAAGVLHIFATDAQGQNAVQLTTGGGWNCDPSWSPDGAKIVFNRCTNTRSYCAANPSALDIYTLSMINSALTQLTADGLADYDPYYSPDGTRIAWLAETDPTCYPVGSLSLGCWGIKIMGAGGSNKAVVINDGQINSKPAWALDSSRIDFHRFEPAAPAPKNRWRLFHIAPSGAGLQEITPTSGNNEYPTH